MTTPRLKLYEPPHDDEDFEAPCAPVELPTFHCLVILSGGATLAGFVLTCLWCLGT